MELELSVYYGDQKFILTYDANTRVSDVREAAKQNWNFDPESFDILCRGEVVDEDQLIRNTELFFSSEVQLVETEKVRAQSRIRKYQGEPASVRTLFLAVRRNETDIALDHISVGVDYAKTFNGVALEDMAAAAGNMKIMRLVYKNTNVRYKTKSPLYYAIVNHRTDVINFISSSETVWLPQNEFQPIQTAVRMGDINLIKMLLKFPVPRYASNCINQLIISSRENDLFEYLLNRPNALISYRCLMIHICGVNDSERCAIFFKHICRKTETFEEALSEGIFSEGILLSCSNGHTAITRLIISKVLEKVRNDKFQIKLNDSKMSDVLYICVTKKLYNLLGYILMNNDALKIDVNRGYHSDINPEEETPLNAAINGCCFNELKLLLDCKGIDVFSGFGKFSALECVCKCSTRKMIELIVESAITTTSQNKDIPVEVWDYLNRKVGLTFGGQFGYTSSPSNTNQQTEQLFNKELALQFLCQTTTKICLHGMDKSVQLSHRDFLKIPGDDRVFVLPGAGTLKCICPAAEVIFYRSGVSGPLIMAPMELEQGTTDLLDIYMEKRLPNTLVSPTHVPVYPGTNLTFFHMIHLGNMLLKFISIFGIERLSPLIKNNNNNCWNLPIHSFAYRKSDVMEVYLKHFGSLTDLNSINKQGSTPLQLACGVGNIIAVTALLKYDSVSVISNHLGNWPLSSILKLGKPFSRIRYQMFESVAKNTNCDLSTDPRSGRLLLYACRVGYHDITRFLLQEGAPMSAVNSLGSTPLMFAVSQEYNKAPEFLQSQLVEVVLSHCSAADINKTNMSGLTALHAAMYKQGYHYAHQLLISDADVNVVSVGGNTPLSIAVKNNLPELCSLLLLYKEPKLFELNVRNTDAVCSLLASHQQTHISLNLPVGRNGTTLLVTAAELRHVKVFKILLWAGADLTAVNATGNSVLEICCGDLVLLTTLREYLAEMAKPKLPPLPKLIAFDSTSSEDSEYLPTDNTIRMTSHFDINKKNKDGNSLLHEIAREPKIRIELLDEVLLMPGVDLNVCDSDGRTPLHITSKFDNLTVTEKLITAGASVNAVCSAGRSPLHYVIGKKVLKALLLVPEIDVNVQDGLLRTPLHVSAINNRCFVIDALLQRDDCKLFLKDSDNRTVWSQVVAARQRAAMNTKSP